MDEKKREAPEGVEIGLDYQFPSQIVPACNYVVAQKDVHEFHLSFFQVQPPIILADAKEKKRILTEMGSVPAVCVARVTIAEGRMPSLIRTLTENYERNVGPLPSTESTGGEPNKELGEKPNG